jgi:hypothetical protein
MSAGQTGLRRGVLLAAVAVSVGLASAGSASAGLPRVLAFTTPDADVNCGVTLAPPAIPKQSLVCTAAKGYIVMRQSGFANVISWNKPFSPLGGQPPTTLASGSHWSWESISCAVSWWTISCTNSGGQNRFSVGNAPKTSNSVPVLGIDGPPTVGFGKSKPSEVYFGGDPTGMFKQLSWAKWGYLEATGKGRGYYDPPNSSTAASVATPVILTASSLGVCHGRLAYRQLAVTFVYKGQDEAGTRESICN